MPSRVYFDYESRSITDLGTRGLANYADDNSTQIVLCAYAFDQEPVKLWDATTPGATVPQEFLDGLSDPFVTKVAWNATFERLITRQCLQIDIPLNEILDVMVWARHISLPGSLDKVAPILGLTHHKMKEGKDLVRLFCEPCHEGGEDTLFGVSEPWFRGKDRHPREWEQFGEYCKADVETMREALGRLESFPLPAFEQSLWELDQVINARGAPTDLALAVGAGKVADRAKEELARQVIEIAAVENAASQPQMLAFLTKEGYPFSSLGKAFVNRALAGEGELTDKGRQVLLLRQQLAKTASTKLVTIRDRVSPDGRLRYQYSFLGAARTGRWAASGDDGSGGAQLHNLPSPTKAVKKELRKAIRLLKAGDYDGIVKEFYNPLEVVGSCIRSVFKAPPGKRFVVADLAGIESRLAGWLTGCKPLLQVFLDGRDPYIDLATEIYGIPYESMVDANGDILPEHAEKRQGGKVGILGCGYQISGGEEMETAEGDKFKSGLWGFAKTLGVEITREQAHQIVRVFRKKYHEVEQAWYDYEAAAVSAIKSGRPQSMHKLMFDPHDGLLRVVLPSGRALHYIKPRVEKQYYTTKTGYEREKEGVTYEGVDPKTKTWTRLKTHGGKWLEQADQGTARDIEANGMVQAEAAGFEIVMHTHDELATLVDTDSPLTVEDLVRCMTSTLKWAPDLPLAAKGYTDSVYRKE